MRNRILELCSLSGVSGNEQSIRDYIVKQLQNAPAVTNIHIDNMGNCIVTLKGERRAPKRVLFAAHMDEVGGIVTGITDDGYLRFDTVGGIEPEVLFDRTVQINGHCGVIGGKAVHQCTADEKNKIPTVHDMLIDVGADSKEEAGTVAKEGDAITFAPTNFCLSKDMFACKALDDRAGCALLLSLAQTTPKYDVTIAFTVQEEIGLRGAQTVASVVSPDLAVIVDATTAADSVDTPSDKQISIIGGGPVVSFMDRATLYDKALYSYIRTTAEQYGISTQTKTMVAGGNDAGAIQRTGKGTQVAAVSLPCRYIHSPSCVLKEQDITDTYRLLEILLNTLPAWEKTV